MAHWYFDAHSLSYIRSHWSIFDGLVWLLSEKSDWLPEKYRKIFIEGLMARDQWAGGFLMMSFENPFLDGLLRNTRKQFKLTKERKEGLYSLVEKAANELGVKKEVSAIIQDLLNLDAISKYYDYKDWIMARRKENAALSSTRKSKASSSK